MIVVIDYGMGNLRSVSKALESLGASVRVSSDPNEVAAASKVILPGVGAFGAAMDELKRRQLVEPIKTVIGGGKPYLGICLGLQLLFEHSEEGDAAGLGLLRGAVKRFAFHSSPTTDHSSLKIPHMGWNQVQRQATSDKRQGECPLLSGIPDKSFFYFVHSYYGAPQDRSVVALETEYGERFASMVWEGRLFATQFHPEKSQALGLRLLKNFIDV
ncbi:MAG: imidazole glycerol phosphate synthase subunit HisH [Candidatus Omnitrophica bacterium]|nr:imidazole glycerol phosphate synthase subunit HisH [Candidatus Omnitrophota bacterium]